MRKFWKVGHYLTLTMAMCSTPLLAQQGTPLRPLQRVPGEPYVVLTQGTINKALPVLACESAGVEGWEAHRETAGFTPADYAALKASLHVARQDARDPARLAGLSGLKLQVRRANLELYKQNAGQIDGFLNRLKPPETCALCRV